MAQITSWDDVCFPVYAQNANEFFNGKLTVTRLREQMIIVQPPVPKGEGSDVPEGYVPVPPGFAPMPHVVAFQSGNYEFVPNSLIRQVADQVLGAAGIAYSVQGHQYGYTDFRYQLVLEEKPIAIGNPRDVIFAAINIANNYAGTGHLTISGKALEQKRVLYADSFETIPAFSVYRQICQNGLWGWRDVDEMAYLESLSRGEKTRKNWRKQLLSRRGIEAPAQIQPGEQLVEGSSQKSLVDDFRKVRHRRGAAEHTRRLLTQVLTSIVAQYELFTKSPAIRMYNVLYDRKITDLGQRIDAVMAAVSAKKVQRKWDRKIYETVIGEMGKLGEAKPNDWLLYNAINRQIWHNDTKQAVDMREKADAEAFSFLLTH